MALLSSVVAKKFRVQSFGSIATIAVLFLCLVPIDDSLASDETAPVTSDENALLTTDERKLHFNRRGKFKILQIADMHHGDGEHTPCKDVLPEQVKGCTGLNTTYFIQRLIKLEKPDLIVFSGDNIFGYEASDTEKSLDLAFSPAIDAKIPWAAVLGNHDQDGYYSREDVMKYIVGLNHTLSKVNPRNAPMIDGFGNYNLEVGGVKGSPFEHKSVLNLYFLDSGDLSTVPAIPGYGWIKPSQQFWFQRTSATLSKIYRTSQPPQQSAAPGLAFFHIPLSEMTEFTSDNSTGDMGEDSSPASVNSGFFTALVEAGDVKAVFTGHDHKNDFCGELKGVNLCEAGGAGYNGYGEAGWPRRARLVLISLEKSKHGWGGVKTIRTWKRLDDEHLTGKDPQILWSESPKSLDP